MITIVELPEFIRRSKKLLTEDEQSNLINYLATHPTAGVLMQGTGGIRKVRWKREGAGRSSGVRVVYYFHSERYPLISRDHLWKIGKGEFEPSRGQ